MSEVGGINSAPAPVSKENPFKKVLRAAAVLVGIGGVAGVVNATAGRINQDPNVSSDPNAIVTPDTRDPSQNPATQIKAEATRAAYATKVAAGDTMAADATARKGFEDGIKAYVNDPSKEPPKRPASYTPAPGSITVPAPIPLKDTPPTK